MCRCLSRHWSLTFRTLNSFKLCTHQWMCTSSYTQAFPFFLLRFVGVFVLIFVCTAHGCLILCMRRTFGNMAAKSFRWQLLMNIVMFLKVGGACPRPLELLFSEDGADNRHLFTEFLWVRGTRSLPAATSCQWSFALPCRSYRKPQWRVAASFSERNTPSLTAWPERSFGRLSYHPM